MTALWLLFMLLMFLSEAFFSGMETGVYCLNRIRLRHRTQEGHPRAVRVSKLIRDPQALVCTTLAGTNLSVYASSAVCTALVSGLVSERYAEFVATLALAPALLVFAEALPKSLFQAHANRLVYRLSWLLQLGSWLLLPVSLLLRGVTYFTGRVFGRRPAPAWSLSEKRLRYFLTEGAREGVLSPEQNVMARNIMRLDDICVRDVMIHLDDVQMISVAASAEDLKRAVARRPHSRLVVYRDERPEIVGAVNLMDLLCSEGAPPVAELVRPLCGIGADQPIDEALLEMQKRRQVMARVTDADGRHVGIITVKDVVEEVVGELHEW